VTKIHWTKFRKRLAAALIIGIIAVVWGMMLLKLALGNNLRLASYDLPFLFGERPPPDDIVLIQLDEASHKELEQPLSQPWDRRLHAKLVDHLAEAKLIVFDILFHDENPEQDPAFAAAIQKHGNVILAGEIVRNTEGNNMQSLLLATPALRRAAKGSGLTEMPIDSDGVVRRIRHVIPTDLGDRPSMSEIIRQRITGLPPAPPKEPQLINYYGPAGSFRGYSYSGVMLGRKMPPGEIRGKIVIIGASQKSGLSDAGKDVFPTPYLPMPVEDEYGVKSRKLTPGVEIQATAAANLLDGEMIHALGPAGDFWLVVCSGFLFAAVACLLPPVRGVLLCILLGVALAVLAIWLRQSSGFQFLWTLPAFGQMPLVAGLALGGHYFIEYSARWKLRRAFKSYMSDEQARQIDEDDVSLELGGKEVQATIMFTDLAGFTSMAEGLPPQSVSKALISYFERATEGILDNQGTIIKYVGDSVMATWGAPLKVEREADRAIDAAIQVQLASAIPISLETPTGIIEQVLETRIGINSGLGLAGNLGSTRRFDYSVIGDTTNTAARLEGLNKMLGTSILVAESVLEKCVDPERFFKRRMGRYVLKGRKQAVVVYEILGYKDQPEVAFRKRTPVYIDLYQQGLNAFEQGDFESATRHLSECKTLHDRLPDDPAARLMLESILKNTTPAGPPPEWSGDIILDSK
jgi:adenylate cyclase